MPSGKASGLWLEGLNDAQQHARAGIDIGGVDMFRRIVADAAATADEQHRYVGDVDPDAGELVTSFDQRWKAKLQQ